MNKEVSSKRQGDECSRRKRVKTKAAEVRRYENRVRQFHQNHLFSINQHQLYKELDRKCDNSQAGSEPVVLRTFWGGLWDQTSEHNKQAEWLANVKDELKNIQQD